MLNGKASSAYVYMDMTESLDYQKVKAAILNNITSTLKVIICSLGFQMLEGINPQIVICVTESTVSHMGFYPKLNQGRHW